MCRWHTLVIELYLCKVQITSISTFNLHCIEINVERKPIILDPLPRAYLNAHHLNKIASVRCRIYFSFSRIPFIPWSHSEFLSLFFISFCWNIVLWVQFKRWMAASKMACISLLRMCSSFIIHIFFPYCQVPENVLHKLQIGF